MVWPKGKACSEDTKRKISNTLTGTKKPKSHGKNVSNARKGIKFTKEHCKNISKGRLKNHDKISNAMKGINIWSKGENNISKRKDVRKKISEFHKGKPKSKEHKEKISIFFKKYWKQYPERHPNRNFSNKKSISKPQLKLFNHIKKIYNDYNIELNHPVITKHSTRFVDIAFPELKIGLEYDGAYWHQDKEADNKRDNELKEVNWKIIHLEEKIFNNIVNMGYMK